jgi:L-ribulokinase
VVRKPIRISGSAQGGALGAAIFGAVAAGRERGGYGSVQEAARELGKRKDKVYAPIAANAAIYDRLYTEYETLHRYFGEGINDVMKRLKKIKSS